MTKSMPGADGDLAEGQPDIRNACSALGKVNRQSRMCVRKEAFPR